MEPLQMSKHTRRMGRTDALSDSCDMTPLVGQHASSHFKRMTLGRFKAINIERVFCIFFLKVEKRMGCH